MNNLPVAFIFCLLSSPCRAGDMEASKNLSAQFAAQLSAGQVPVPAPSAAAQAGPSRRSPDPVLKAISDAQWNAIFSRPEAAHAKPHNRELYSDHHIRYIVKGQVNFASDPPLLTADTGKVFRITGYPGWLKETGAGRICVEGYTKQIDDTGELQIENLLPPDTLDNLEPSAAIRDLQRDSTLMARDGDGYVLGNVAWGLKHDENGAILKDTNGNPVSIWNSGVKVNTALLEEVYFLKKLSLIPLHYGQHGMLLFRFKPGGVTAPDGSTTTALVVSLDAYYTDPARMGYSPLDALLGKYQVYYSIQTIERYSEMKFNYNEFSMSMKIVLVPYPLRLTRGQQLRLLDNAVAKATGNNKGEMYSLFYNSCANSALSLINSALPPENKISAGWMPEIIYRTQASFPDAMAAVLLKKDLAGEPLPEITSSNFRGYFPD